MTREAWVAVAATATALTVVATPVLLFVAVAVFDDKNDLTKRDPFTTPVPGFWETRWPLVVLGVLLLATLAAWAQVARLWKSPTPR